MHSNMKWKHFCFLLFKFQGLEMILFLVLFSKQVSSGKRPISRRSPKKERKEATEEGKMNARFRLAMLAAVLAATADVSFHPEKLHFPAIAVLFQVCIIIPSRGYAAMQRVYFFGRRIQDFRKHVRGILFLSTSPMKRGPSSRLSGKEDPKEEGRFALQSRPPRHTLRAWS